MPDGLPVRQCTDFEKFTQSLVDSIVSYDFLDNNLEPAGLTDGLMQIARSIDRLAGVLDKALTAQKGDK